MQKLSVMRWCQVLGFSALLAGCAGAEWQQVTVSPTYQPPKQVKVALASQSPTQNSDQAMQALQEAMADTFASKGITATFVAPPAGPPDASMSVAEWNQGSRALRWLIGFGAGEGTIGKLVNDNAVYNSVSSAAMEVQQVAENLRRLGGYTLLNLATEWTIDSRTTVFVRGDNVLGRDYALAADFATGGARVTAGVRWRL